MKFNTIERRQSDYKAVIGQWVQSKKLAYSSINKCEAQKSQSQVAKFMNPRAKNFII
jgi:hypothetical protein